MLTPIITTPRLTLRPFRKGDEADTTVIMRSDRVNPTYMLPDLDEAGAKKLFARFVEMSAREDRFVAAVCLEDRVIGWLNDTEICGDSMELGWVIHPDYWGQGDATEAVRAAVKALHGEGFRCVYAGAFTENPASLRVMQKAGMTLMDKTEDLEYRGKTHHCIFYASER